MSLFLDPSGQPTFGIGICARCSRKMLLAELSPDPNYPGLMVCAADKDEYDPYRLAPRAPDKVILPFNRPDEDVSIQQEGIILETGGSFLTTEDGRNFFIPNV